MNGGTDVECYNNIKGRTEVECYSNTKGSTEVEASTPVLPFILLYH